MRKFAMPLKCSKFDRDGQQVKCIKAPCDESKSWWNLEACLNFTKQNNLLNAHEKNATSYRQNSCKCVVIVIF